MNSQSYVFLSFKFSVVQYKVHKVLGRFLSRLQLAHDEVESSPTRVQLPRIPLIRKRSAFLSDSGRHVQ